ncbi:hypothetical protein [Nocardia mangyaensis]|uniref:hypothetical protein n=1 Tax=Nocardia mangyaensis TaxID=2213200 RepID=UPI00267542EF|nr:hypothetical protein [Nocardia mangyaensis]MDO3650899.1 hypothetical protein [Nocardia mangyaensis]
MNSTPVIQPDGTDEQHREEETAVKPLAPQRQSDKTYRREFLAPSVSQEATPTGIHRAAGLRIAA